MGPGFIRGVIVGAAASALGLSALSLSTPLPQSPEAGTQAPRGGQTPAVPQQSAQLDGGAQDADLVEAPPAPPKTADQSGAQSDPVATSATDPGALPQVGAASDGLSTPSESATPSDVQVDTAADQTQGAATQPATTPQTAPAETELSISTLPAQPQPPDVSDTAELAPAPATGTAPQIQASDDPDVTVDPSTNIASPQGQENIASADVTNSASQPQIGGATGLTAPAGTSDTVSDVTLRALQSTDPAVTSNSAAGIETPFPDSGDSPAQVPGGTPAPQIAGDATGLESPAAPAETSSGVASGSSNSTAPVIAAAPSAGISAPANTPETSPEGDTQSAAAPQVGSAEAGLGAPTAPATSGVELGQAAPEAPGQTDIAPQSPTQSAPATASTEAAPTVSTQPAAPVSDTQAPRLAALPQVGVESTPSTLGSDAAIPGTPAPSVIDDTPETPDNADAAETAAGLPPIQAFAEPFEDPQGRPMMSIILIDEPGSIGAEALADFPYPLTFALDPTAPDAETKMRAHRAVGFEVVALIDLPLDARPTDAEVSMAIWLDELDQSVAVLEGTGSGLQGNRPLSDQVTDIVLQSGLGLITLDNGLNTVQKLAEREGVPSTVVFRDFDGAGQTPTVMRRFLDQAAFRAGQQGSVVMLGRLRPDTVSALLLWGLQDRASRVALAPVSAVLTQKE